MRSAAEEEEINLLEGGYHYSIWEEVSTRENGEFSIKKKSSYTKKKQKNKKKNNTNNKPINPVEFPEEIIFEILTRLPVELLHEKIRYICKQWNIIISSPLFINQSMLRSKPIQIIQNLRRTKILEIKDEKLACHPYAQGILPKTHPRFRSTCNGLLLVNNPQQARDLRVMNPVIKQQVTLPRCPSGCPHRSCGCGIAFAPSTGEYKVVHVYADLFGFEIFTLGCLDNTWRRIPGPFKHPYERPFGEDFKWNDPVLVNQSMLHWNVDSHEYIISMDVSNEKLLKTYLPNHNCSNGDDGIINCEAILQEMGGFLSIFFVSELGIDVWVLKDFEKQVWIKQHSIVPENVRYVNSADGRMPRGNNLTPVAVDGTVIFFLHNSLNSGLYTYEMESGTLKKYKLKINDGQNLVSHVNTLNWFKALAPQEANQTVGSTNV